MDEEDLFRVFHWARMSAPLSGSHIHGERHWLDVKKRGLRLAANTPGADKVVVELFAYVHDCRRIGEGRDLGHGQRAADCVEEIRDSLLAKLTDDQYEKLRYALANHTGGKPVDDPTIGCCFDSDRLDLVRLFIKPSEHQMSTEAGKLACKYV